MTFKSIDFFLKDLIAKEICLVNTDKKMIFVYHGLLLFLGQYKCMRHLFYFNYMTGNEQWL